MKVIPMGDRPQYAYFRTLANPHASVTAELDISRFYRRIKELDYPFFLTLLHCAAGAANAVAELRRRIWKDQVVEFACCPTSHTLALPDGNYCYCNLDPSMPLEDFLPYAMQQTEKALAAPSLSDGEEALSYLFITSLPWLHFTALNLPTAGAEDSNPRISFGQYLHSGEKLLLPVSLQTHHGLVDGIHMSRFFAELETRLNAI